MEDSDEAQARARASQIGLKPESIDGFADMDRATLILQAALWRDQAMAHQNRSLDVEFRSGEVIAELFALCQRNGVAISEAIHEKACTINDRWKPARNR